ncbi:MAG: DSBA-like protein thioredoxin domain-containing protein [Candidatus Woesebacteria bacterium GW2011_GWB1_38_5b]|uniref:DSBA-like protein thioredoxin domain-containing protein n=1 Tax=Candidatus Woesebacteria bacterium GW2011_GWB1_38_5b TaxID=1618569 RepID=A0A0G0NDS3_9BACT|nr:MAG: DSBA-like protein thioredoxin domain-containing protein [Candidatus Woesebacteria bacterium GW2011_GWB1_38_5b]
MPRTTKALEPVKQSIFERFAPIMLIAIIVLTFFVGTLWQKVQDLEKGDKTLAAANNQPTQAAPTPPAVDISQIKSLFTNDKLIKFGDENKKALFVAVEDPSCPYCSIASGLNPELNKSAGSQFLLVKDGGTYVAPVIEMKKLVDQGKASFAYIYTPGHGNGEMGTKALYCAQEKGKFWEAHDTLMTNKGYDLLNNTVKNDKAKSGELSSFLASAIDSSFLKSCLDSGKYDGRLQSDIALAQELGVRGTPGFFVNDKNFAGAYNYKDMEPAVNEALK